MSKELEAYWKIDHTICMNSNEGNIRWNIDKKENYGPDGEGYNPVDTDCKSVQEAISCLDIIESSIKDFNKLKEGIAWRKDSYKKELDQGFDQDGVPLTETNRIILWNLYNLMCALEGYYTAENGDY